VDHLDQHLRIIGAEEPEEPPVSHSKAIESHGMAISRKAAALRGLIVNLDLEAAVPGLIVDAQRRGAGSTGPGGCARGGPPDAEHCQDRNQSHPPPVKLSSHRRISPCLSLPPSRVLRLLVAVEAESYDSHAFNPRACGLGHESAGAFSAGSKHAPESESNCAVTSPCAKIGLPEGDRQGCGRTFWGRAFQECKGSISSIGKKTEPGSGISRSIPTTGPRGRPSRISRNICAISSRTSAAGRSPGSVRSASWIPGRRIDETPGTYSWRFLFDGTTVERDPSRRKSRQLADGSIECFGAYFSILISSTSKTSMPCGLSGFPS